MLTRRLGVALGLLALLYAPAQAQTPADSVACDVCLPPNTVKPLETLFEPGFQISFGGQYTSSGTIMNGSRTISNPIGQYIDTLNTQLQLGYNIERNVGVQLTLPFIARSWRRPFNGVIQNGDISGLGDISLTANYAPVQQFDKDSALVLNLIGGLKLPTGNSSFLSEQVPGAGGGVAHNHAEEDADHQDRELYPIKKHGDEDHGEEEEAPALPASAIDGHDLALGSGSVDGILGGSLFFRQDSFFLNTGCQAQLRTTGSYGYRYGNLFQWNIGPGFTVIRDEDLMMGLEMDALGEHKGPDYESGVKTDHFYDYVFLGPNLWVSSSDVYGQLGVDIPVHEHVGELQPVPDYRVKLNVTVRL